jgi:hypothetical protein
MLKLKNMVLLTCLDSTTEYLQSANYTILIQNCTNAGAAAAAVLAPLSGHTCWIVLLPVCSRARALHGPLWVCLPKKTLFVIQSSSSQAIPNSC